jgi:hypothetical protein
MVITFNKREFLEFANYTINQSKLPRVFSIRYGDKKIKEVLKIANKKLNGRWKLNALFTEQGKEGFVVFNLNAPEGHYKTFWVNKDSIVKPELTVNEFIKGMLFEDTPYFDSDDVDLWMEHEKHIKPINVGMVAPN